MSELTKCNYCSLQAIKRDAKKKGLKVVIVPSKVMSTLGGVEVHIVKLGDKLSKENWVSWMMKVTDSCVC